MQGDFAMSSIGYGHRFSWTGKHCWIMVNAYSKKETAYVDFECVSFTHRICRKSNVELLAALIGCIALHELRRPGGIS